MNSITRPIRRDDLTALKKVLDSSELFPSELLNEMIAPYLSGDSEDIWFTSTLDDQVISIGYCAPERMTSGTYNLYAIAVHKDYQGKGIGTKMMNYIEDILIRNDHRILLVETSGLDDYELTRRFYRTCGYTEQAVIPEFYEKGEDKVIFWKRFS